MESQHLAAARPLPNSAVNAVLSNRRRYPRYASESRAEVCVPQGGLLFRGKILDLSLSGCFIETPAINLERGTQVEIYFVARQMQFRVGGHIAVLHRKRGAGIAFQELDPRRSRQITELLGELKQLPEPQEPAPDA